MAEPIEYDILLNLKTALEAISIAGGYHHDVGAVSVDPADHTEALLGTSAQVPFFIVEIATARGLQYFPASQLLERIPVDITAAHNAEQLVQTARLQTFQRLAADIEKALTVDVTRGGRATDTRIVDKQMFMSVGGQRVLAVVQCEVRLYREYGKP